MGAFPKVRRVFRRQFRFPPALIRLDSKYPSPFSGVGRATRGRREERLALFRRRTFIELYQNALPLSESDLELMKQRIAGRRDRLAAKGIGYEFVIAPDKHTIYPEFMPSRFLRKPKPSQYAQTMEMARAADLPVVDLRPDLLAAKPLGQLYRRDDTHWNDLGVSVAMGPMFDACGPGSTFTRPRFPR